MKKRIIPVVLLSMIAVSFAYTPSELDNKIIDALEEKVEKRVSGEEEKTFLALSTVLESMKKKHATNQRFGYVVDRLIGFLKFKGIEKFGYGFGE